MKTCKSSTLMKGNAEIYIPNDKGYKFNSDGDITLTDQNGMPIDNAGKSPGIINVKVPKGTVWMVHYQEANHHPSDEIPTEVPIANSPSIMERMRAMIYAEVANKYGADSEEVDTLEEAMDFDLDGDGQIGSPYELPDEEFVEEVIAPPPPAEPATQEPAPAPTEPETPTDPTAV